MDKKIHYSGGIIHASGSYLPGWACCCTGQRCYTILREGNFSDDQEKVTCSACKRRLENQLAYASKGHASYAVEWLRKMGGVVPSAIETLERAEKGQVSS